LFIRSGGVVGFPFLLPRAALPAVAAQIETGRFSLYALAKVLEAELVRMPRRLAPQLRNINTPDEWHRARRLWEERTLVGRPEREPSSARSAPDYTRGVGVI
jgi:CTP:molybdopterin cytidylyltransferase MocA